MTRYQITIELDDDRDPRFNVSRDNGVLRGRSFLCHGTGFDITQALIRAGSVIVGDYAETVNA